MRKAKLFIGLIALILSFGFVSCTDDTDPVQANLPNDFFVLCEGLYGMNNSSLDFYDSKLKIMTLDIFNEVNNQRLGDTGNDMIEFYNYIFIAVKESACVQVINKNNGKLIKRITTVDNNGKNRKSSRLATNGSMVYLCTVDGNVLEINPSSLSIGRIVKVGRNPEAICISNNKLYVTNSGGLDFGSPIGYDKTVSVVNISTMTEIKKIEVGENPGIIKELRPGLVGLIVKGDYSNIKFKTINTFNDEVVSSFEIPMLSFDVLNNSTIIYTNFDYFNSMGTTIKLFNHSTNSINTLDFIKTPGIISQIVLPYGIDISKATNEVYICDAADFVTSGRVFVFDLKGNYKDKVNVSYVPSKVIVRK